MQGPLMNLIYCTLIIIGITGILLWFTMGVGIHGPMFRLRWEHLPLTALIIFCFWLPIRNWRIIRKRSKG
jgi:hypothetical protein